MGDGAVPGVGADDHDPGGCDATAEAADDGDGLGDAGEGLGEEAFDPDDLAVDPDAGATASEDSGDLAALQDRYARLLADFDNHRKRTAKQATDEVDRAAGRIVEGLLPVLDACDAAIQHGTEGVEPILGALLAALGREGLEPIASDGAPFDPELHEAVMHESGTEGDGPMVSQVLRSGYQWRGKVLRPAMVQVRD